MNQAKSHDRPRDRALTASLYRDWRDTHLPCSLFVKEGETSRPSERLLQELWYHQRLATSEVRTADNAPLRLWHPGFWNHEAGPDFLNAIVQFGKAPPQTGDIEIDLEPSNWYAHKHEGNPSYSNVMLHVVWESSARPVADRPILVLRDWTDEPLETLQRRLAAENMPSIPGSMLGHCCAPMNQLSPKEQIELIEQAAAVRLEMKAARLRARSRHVGWNRTLWEGLFSGLGYKHNVWPMRRLAESVLDLSPASFSNGTGLAAWQARLLGMAGLIPSELTRRYRETDDYLRQVWCLWWREREPLSEGILPASLWRFSGLRPANRPERRLALAGHWLAQEDLIARLEEWILSDIPAKALLPRLLQILQVEHDPFWSRHWTLKSQAQETAHPLLGPQRATDLAINVILPWFWTRAEAGRNRALQESITQRYFAWPSGESNTLLRFAHQRLLGRTKSPLPRTAAMQQGLLQIFRDFCEHSNALCEACHFPELVRHLQQEKESS